MAYAIGKNKSVKMIDSDMGKRAFDAMYGVHAYLVEKEARSRRHKKNIKKILVDNTAKSC